MADDVNLLELKHLSLDGTYDCLIVGAGPAGLTAAVYLSRFRRSVVVVDTGTSRASRIPMSHNIPGFADGITGPDILRRHNEQAAVYGIVPRVGDVDTLQAESEGFACLVAAENGERATMRARTVLLATGVQDNEPDMPDLAAAISAGLIRICPVCDAFEAMDNDIAVLGDGAGAVAEAIFMRTYSDRVTLLLTEGARCSSPEDQAKLANHGIGVVEGRVAALVREDDERMIVRTIGGDRLRYDTIYAALGSRARSALAAQLGAELDGACDAIVVDQHQRASVPGLWAAGDVASSLNQVAVAWGQAAVAATDIHNHLRGGGTSDR
ncbi:NAD(P)/FAD-dependent oxidoreductase [Antarcticirhabdus aurantiaca]|uniref:NAD(P)/FAD-dependent oxidoreductase n=1 Tax=Antarcticirhabdus aurantiaca TaxID=2606717 RepID=A0ACD4NW31_9HYPH|nr:NAD(P)/FAD-dependent oxidoreductase [Jeongeuplla avenae]